MDFQNPATLVMDYIDWFSWYTLIIVTLDRALRGRASRLVRPGTSTSAPIPSPRASPTTRLIEVLWTVLPVLILVAIAIPSFKLLYGQYDPSKLYADFDPRTTKFLTLKFTGVPVGLGRVLSERRG